MRIPRRRQAEAFVSVGQEEQAIHRWSTFLIHHLRRTRHRLRPRSSKFHACLKALELPPPTYPAIARQIKLRGSVTVQVLIDESGKVVSAKALSGHTAFIDAAESAARRARFSPTTINDQPVKVQGVITYNFVMN